MVLALGVVAGVLGLVAVVVTGALFIVLVKTRRSAAKGSRRGRYRVRRRASSVQAMIALYNGAAGGGDGGNKHGNVTAGGN